MLDSIKSHSMNGDEEITRDDFLDYEEVRQSGATNMFAIRTVCELSGLDRKQVLHIQKKYGFYKAKYLPGNDD